MKIYTRARCSKTSFTDYCLEIDDTVVFWQSAGKIDEQTDSFLEEADCTSIEAMIMH